MHPKNQFLFAVELVTQRPARRWLNGSFFAAIQGTHYIYRSTHSFMCKFGIHVELVYQTFNLIFPWFALVRYLFFLLVSPLTDFQENFLVSFFVLTNALVRLQSRQCSGWC